MLARIHARSPIVHGNAALALAVTSSIEPVWFEVRLVGRIHLLAVGVVKLVVADRDHIGNSGRVWFD